MGRGMRAGKRPKMQAPGGGRKAQQQQMAMLQAMQEQVAATQAELDEKEITASVGGGIVSATVNGKKELVSLTIGKDAVDPDDIESLQDLIIAAVNEGMRQIDELSKSEYDKVTGGLNIPGL